MKDISTVILMTELRNRLQSELYGENAPTDPMIEELLKDQDVFFTNLDSIHNTLNSLINRYYSLLSRSEQ